LEEASKTRSEAENAKNVAIREKTHIQMQLEENEEQLAEVRDFWIAESYNRIILPIVLFVD